MFFKGFPMVTLDDQVGEGHYGRVYTFEHDCSKVIKVFKEESTSSLIDLEFRAQAAAWAVGLAPKPLEVGVTDDSSHAVILMERIKANSLEAFSQRELDAYFKDLVAKVKAYHQSGWAHGDIKRPDDVCGNIWDNIWLTTSGIVLLDYGMAIFKGDFEDFPDEFEDQVQQDLEDLDEYQAVLKRKF